MGYSTLRLYAPPLPSSKGSRAYRSFVQKLRAARDEAGLTQQEAARRLGKPQSFISKCESGERRVDVIELQLLADLYGKDLKDFLP